MMLNDIDQLESRVNLDSLCTSSSTGRGTLQGTRHFDERAPLMHKMDERRREKDRRLIHIQNAISSLVPRPTMT